MLVNEVIEKLQKIVEDNPEKGLTELYVYITNIDELSDDEIHSIILIDDDISDRVDINI